MSENFQGDYYDSFIYFFVRLKFFSLELIICDKEEKIILRIFLAIELKKFKFFVVYKTERRKKI